MALFFLVYAKIISHIAYKVVIKNKKGQTINIVICLYNAPAITHTELCDN